MGHSAKSRFYRYALCSLRWALSEIDYIFNKNCLGDSYILTLNEYKTEFKTAIAFFKIFLRDFVYPSGIIIFTTAIDL